MSSTATSAQIHQRIRVLLDLSYRSLLASELRFGPEQQELFNLKTNDSRELIARLNRVFETLPPSDELESARYALGIGVGGDTLEVRRERLMEYIRDSERKYIDLKMLALREHRGMHTIASVFDLVG